MSSWRSHLGLTENSLESCSGKALRAALPRKLAESPLLFFGCTIESAMELGNQVGHPLT